MQSWVRMDVHENNWMRKKITGHVRTVHHIVDCNPAPRLRCDDSFITLHDAIQILRRNQWVGLPCFAKLVYFLCVVGSCYTA